jgi:hypothetical protein
MTESTFLPSTRRTLTSSTALLALASFHPRFVDLTVLSTLFGTGNLLATTITPLSTREQELVVKEILVVMEECLGTILLT